jgi:hypothetical protein
MLPFLATLKIVYWHSVRGTHTSAMPEAAAPESVPNRHPKDAQTRAATIRLLQVLAAAALLLPLLFSHSPAP